MKKASKRRILFAARMATMVGAACFAVSGISETLGQEKEKSRPVYIATEEVTETTYMPEVEETTQPTETAKAVETEEPLIATASPFSISPTVNVTPKYNLLTLPTIPTTTSTPAKHAAGGRVGGGPQLSWLAEEGWDEFVIPTNPSRRTRALELYEQAGEALGVSKHAEGGRIEGSNLSDMVSDHNLFTEATRNASYGYNETTGSIRNCSAKPLMVTHSRTTQPADTNVPLQRVNLLEKRSAKSDCMTPTATLCASRPLPGRARMMM